MKSYRKSLCAILLAAFFVVGLGGCRSMCPGSGTWFGSEPEHIGPRTTKEFLDQQRPGHNLRPA